MPSPRLLIVICSVRPGRVGGAIGDWFATQAREHGTFEVEVADLEQWKLPFMDEPKHPQLHEYVHEHTKKWSATVAAADAVVFVTPEYNYAMPASLKNAIDYLYWEWQKLAISWVSYGGMSGGLRAVQHAKQATDTVGTVSTRAAVALPFAPPKVVEGVFAHTDENNQAAAALLDELLTLSQGLAPMRAKALEKLSS